MLYLASCRNYKNKYIWACSCGRKTRILFHRSLEEIKNGDSPVKQICSERHITIPNKFCNKCFVRCNVGDITCVYCEPEVIEMAKQKMIEDNGN